MFNVKYLFKEYIEANCNKQIIYTLITNSHTSLTYIYIYNKIGPNTDPWGRPADISDLLDKRTSSSCIGQTLWFGQFWFKYSKKYVGIRVFRLHIFFIPLTDWDLTLYINL